VPNDVFAFIISDKGGLDDEIRNTAMNITEAKRILLQHAARSFSLSDGKVVLPPLTYRTLELSSIKTIVLHNRSNIRRDHINSILGAKNLDYRLFDCVQNLPYLQSGIQSMIQILSELLDRPSFEPVLFLEDDVMSTDVYTNTIEVPTDADSVYIGLSNYYSSFGSRPTVPWIDINNDKLVQITDMLSLHAFVIMSERWIHVLLACMNDVLKDPISWDIPVARKLKEYAVYGFKQPLFYQYGPMGGQEGGTMVTLDDEMAARVMR
jgi:hypothetical protein